MHSKTFIGEYMTGKQLLLVCIAVLVVFCITAIIAQTYLQRQRQAARRKAIIRQMLETAQGQNEIFDIKILDASATHKGLAALLQNISPTSLGMEVLSFVSQELVGVTVEVYFRATLPEGPTFYKFRAVIESVASGRKKSQLRLTSPEDLAAGQKRVFIRIKPPKDKVSVIGVWEIDSSKPIPRSTSEISRPLLHYKRGMEKEPVQVENISATGMALRFPMEDLGIKPVDLDKGSQLLCLIIYHMGKDEKIITFWCTCTVLHARVHEGSNPALVLGTEFTNWAVLEQGKSDIHWFHSTPSRGVSPITQWVMHMDMEQRKLL